MRRVASPKQAPRPGADSRVWLTYAYVTELGYDPEQGMFADVEYAPAGDSDTVFFGGPYSGNGFGLHCPVAVGDIVLIANANGDPNTGPLIVGKLWNASQRPAAAFAGEGDDPTQDVVLVVRPGQKLRVATSGSGDGVEMVVGSGDWSAQAGGNATLDATGLVRLQAGTEGAVKGESLATPLNAFLTSLGAFVGALAVPPATPITTDTVAAALTASNLAVTLANLQTASATYVSQKVKVG